MTDSSSSGPEVTVGPNRPADGQGSAGRSRQRGVRAALVSLAPPEASPRFWKRISRELDDKDQLDIVTRPAVRSISEPPPISQPTLDDDPRHALAAYRPSGFRPQKESAKRSTPMDDDDARKRRLLVVAGVVAVLAVLGLASVLGGDDKGPPANATTTVDVAGAVPGDESTPATPAPIPGLDATVPLSPGGVGPLYIGMTLGELHDSGVVTILDQPTFDGSGGTCYDVGLPGASDLILRFRSGDPSVGVADPREGVLASVNISQAFGSPRVTETGVGLGATEEQLGAAYEGNLRVYDRPDISGGRIYLDRASDGLGVTYATDGHQVTDISVGEESVIRLRQACT
ncbi:MAG TPA: hypothetical protein VGJ86_17010 [Acidimicrobiales bacterium]|jgi:hypothetical protein